MFWKDELGDNEQSLDYHMLYGHWKYKMVWVPKYRRVKGDVGKETDIGW